MSSPVLLFSGGDSYPRQQRVRKLLEDTRRQKWRVVEVEGGDMDRLRRVVSGSPLFRGSYLVLITNPGDVDPEFVLRHLKNPIPGITLALHQEGEIGRSKVLKDIAKALPNKCHIQFKSPPFWKQVEAATAFCMAEAEARGKKFPEPLAEKTVEAIGVSDLGFLAQEMFKICMLLSSEGQTEITAKHVAATATIMGEASLQPIIDSLAACKIASLASALDRVEKTTSGDPTMKVTRLVAPTIAKWIAAAILDEKGVEQKEAATQLDLHPWLHKTKILPPAKRWGSRRLLSLLGDLAVSERAIFRGTVAPWIGLCARLLRACQDTRNGRGL